MRLHSGSIARVTGVPKCRMSTSCPIRASPSARNVVPVPIPPTGRLPRSSSVTSVILRARVALPSGAIIGRSRNQTVAVLSPHLDDAVFSLGAFLHGEAGRGADLRVVTVLANDPAAEGQAGSWDAQSGFASAG